MIRRTAAIVSAGLLAATVFSGVAGAEDPPAAATGTVACRLVGRMTFSTPLANGGTTATTATFTAKAAGCTGTDGGAAVKFGVVTGTVSLPANDCAALTTPGAITLDTTVHWRTTGGAPAIADTTLSIGTFTGDPASLLKPKYSATGSASAGSFSGQSVSATMAVSQAFTAIGQQCQAGRLRGFTVRASQSRLEIGTPPAPVV
jgi:hypothetical protein